jgi:isopenicillin N synthase-like dioxygenase
MHTQAADIDAHSDPAAPPDRVINTSGRERYSCAFFIDSSFHTLVECLPCCVSANRPAAYSPTTAGQHLLSKYAATHEGYDVAQKQARLVAEREKQQQAD